MATSGLAFRERLLPRWWVWLVVAALVAMLAIAYGAALGSAAGLAVGGAAGALAGWLLWITAPTIVVDDDGLAAGGARLPAASIGAVGPLDADGVDEALRSDARVFTAVRPWSTRTGVLVTLADDEDPHPAWVLSTRQPDRLVAALTTRAAIGPD